MSIEIKGGIIGEFTFTEDKSTEFYNKESIGVRDSVTIDFKCIVGIHCDGNVTKIEVTELESDGSAAGVLINELHDNNHNN